MTLAEPTVFCMNLRFGRADDGANGWHRRHRIVARLLEKHPADFYAFQEVNDFQFDDLQHMLPRYQFIGRRHPAPDWWQNNLIFYHPKWQCTASDHFYLSSTPDIPSKLDDSKWPRQCTMGEFTQAGQHLICITTHFDFEPNVQAESARIILTRLKAMATTTTPTILTGDFNATPNDRCYHIFTGTQSHVRKSGPDTKKKTPGINHHLSGKETLPVFKNAFLPPYPSTHHGFTGIAKGGFIDWILYRGGIIPEDARIIKEAYQGRYPSDHFPLIVTFRRPQ